MIRSPFCSFYATTLTALSVDLMSSFCPCNKIFAATYCLKWSKFKNLGQANLPASSGAPLENDRCIAAQVLHLRRVSITVGSEDESYNCAMLLARRKHCSLITLSVRECRPQPG